MPMIETINFRCQDPDAQRRFYCDVLGMGNDKDGTVGYQSGEARLKFTRGEMPYAPSAQDQYWKIALAVPDIELACRQLTDQGVSVSDPHQFQDVGYLAHFRDPEGFAIELIAHTFKGEGTDEPIDPNRLGGGAHLNLLTLRTDNINEVQQNCLDWGMKPLSIQPVAGRGFTLYFFAFTQDIPPSPELTAIENRCWVYKRPYTVLEFQHVHDSPGIEQSKPDSSGFTGVEISGVVSDTGEPGKTFTAFD